MVMRSNGEHIAEQRPLQVNLNLNLPDGFAEAIMLLLTRLTASPAASPEVTTTETRTSPSPPPPPKAPDCETSAPDAVPDDLRTIGELNLAYCVEQDRLENKSPSSISSTASGCSAFDQWLNDYRTIHPVVGQSKSPTFSTIRAISDDPQILRRFANYSISELQNSAATARRKVTAVRKVLRACMKAGLAVAMPDNPAQSELDKLAGFKSEMPETVTVEEYLKIRAAAKVATWPVIGRRSAEDFWLFAIDTCWTYGSRSLDWFSYKPALKPGVLWSDVCLDAVCPVPQMKGFEHPDGWVQLPIGKSRTRKLLLPLSSVLRSHFDKWKGVSDDRVVPLTDNKKSYGANWRAILEAAGVDTRIRLSEGSGGPSFRKGAGLYWEDISEELADYVSGRRVKSVRGKHYAQTARRVCQHVNQIPGQMIAVD